MSNLGGLTEQFAADVRAVEGRLGTRIARVWPLVRINDLAGTIGQFAAATVPLVEAAALENLRVSRTYVANARNMQGAGPALYDIDPGLPNTTAIENSVRGAALAGIINARKRGFPAGPSLEQGMVNSVNGAGFVALATGRNWMKSLLRTDPQLLGYQRVTPPGECEWCQELARIGVVRDERSIGFHNNDRCVVEPVFA